MYIIVFQKNLVTIAEYFIIFEFYYSPVAESLALNTSAIISNDDGLLRTSKSCINPPSSSTLYVEWLNSSVIATYKEQDI